LTDVTPTDVVVTLVPEYERADFVFRIRDADQESIGQGAIRCSDLKIITFNSPLPNVPLGSSALECGTEQDSIGNVRVCSNP